MGFFDFLGEVAGKMAAMGEELQSLRSEYENMSNAELVGEYKELKGKSGNDNKNRFKVIVVILKERGVIKEN